MRFYLSTVVIRSVGDDYAFLGTLTVNLLGCFIIGLLAVIIARTTHLSPHAQRLLITGLIGSLTTFSTFALDTLNLLLVWLGMLVAGAILPDIPQQTTDSPSPASGSSH